MTEGVVQDKPVVLLVDGDKEALRHLGSALQSDYRVRVANSVERALAVAQSAPPVDLILLGAGLDAADSERMRASVEGHRTLQVSAPWHLGALRLAIAERLGRPVRAPAELGGRRALVADDEELIRTLLTESLSAVGIGVVTASDGLEVLEQMRRECFDWVLLDMQMPNLDGLHACRAIRADPQMAAAVLIAVTGNDTEAEHQRCLAAGINALLAKPVQADTLYALLKVWLSPNSAPAQGLPAVDTVVADVDLRQLDTLTEGDPERLRRYVTRFGEAMQIGFTEMSTALGTGNLSALSRQAHSLKSTARWFGAAALGRQLEAVEKFPLGDNQQELQATLQRCRELSERANEQLQHHLNASNNSAELP